MYTTPLSTLISSCSLNHHLYADDTQLFLSFLPTHLDSSIDHSSKTEFLLIGLSKQLAKINNSSLTTTHLLETSASYLLNTSLFLTRSHLSPSLAITISASFAVSVHTSIPTKTASTIATSIVHSKLDYCNSLSQPAQVSDHPAPTDPELSCTCCYQSSQIQSHHSSLRTA